MEARDPVEYRPRVPRRLTRADRRALRRHDRRLGDRVIQARTPTLGGIRPADRRRARRACARRSEPLSRHPARDRARPEDDLDQPARRAPGTAPGCRVALPERARRRARLGGDDVNVRPIAGGDHQAIVDLLAADEELVFGRASPITVNDLREWLSRTKLETDSWLYEDAGDVCAAGWCDSAPTGDVSVGVGVVRPGWKGRGIGTELADRSEACAAKQGAARIHQFALGPDTAARTLFLGRGYRDVRHFFTMAIELAERPDAPSFGVEPVTEQDIRAFHAALDEAFQDHWESHSTPFEEWWERHEANPNL